MVPGGIYRLGLDVDAPSAMHPAWLAGAVGASLPGAEVVGVHQPTDKHADVTVRWRGAAQDVSEGASVVPLSAGLELIPGADFPAATVSAIEKLREPAKTRSLEREGPEIWKLAVSFAMIGAVAFTIYRVGKKS